MTSKIENICRDTTKSVAEKIFDLKLIKEYLLHKEGELTKEESEALGRLDILLSRLGRLGR